MSEFAGTLRERIVVEQPQLLRNAMGLQQEGWSTLFRCFASIVLESVGSESEGQALSAMPRFRVTMRKRSGVSVGNRIRWAGRQLLVRQVLEDPASRDRMTMRCEEVRA